MKSILNFIVGADRGAERAENQAEWSSERELQKNHGAERTAEREVAAREWSGACRNRLERERLFPAHAPLLSQALVRGQCRRWTV